VPGPGFSGSRLLAGPPDQEAAGKIRRGLPDVLDLLVICIEAGLSLDQATVRASEELRHAQPELCDELHVVVLEQRAGRPRQDTWKHLAERTDVDCVRNLVSMLVQAEQFGTSIGKTLRTHSDTLRTQRIQQVEEMAAKTTIKLYLPAGAFHLSLAVPGGSGTGGHHHDGFVQNKVVQRRRSTALIPAWPSAF
jgi:tight adherence protein C